RAERDGEPLARALATRAVTPVAPPPPNWASRLNGRVVAVFPRLSELASRITIETVMLDEQRYLRERTASHGIDPQVEIVGVEPTEAEIARACDSASFADATILFLYDAHLFASNQRLLEALQKRARALAVVLMRDPYDAEYVAPGVGAITAYGWRACQLDAVLSVLLTPRDRHSSAGR